MYKRLLIFIFFVSYSGQLLANKCSTYRDKYQQVQLKQKQAHSAKQSVTLQKKELTAWQNWMDCKKGKLKKKKSSKKTVKDNHYNENKSPKKIVTLYSGSVFESKKGLVMKGEYSGIKQQAWLDYYEPEKKCKKPKSTQTFAYCLAEKEKQQKLFEAQY